MEAGQHALTARALSSIPSALRITFRLKRPKHAAFGGATCCCELRALSAHHGGQPLQFLLTVEADLDGPESFDVLAHLYPCVQGFG